MEIEDKRRYFKLIVKRYHRAGRREKSQILTEFCANVGLCRKYAIRLSNEGYSRRRARPGRRSRYQGKLFLKILKKIWWVSEWQCGKLLKGTLPGIVPHYESSYEKIPDEERALLLAVSAATIDRVLRSEKGKFRRGRGSTKPGSLLRNQIPISTEVWDIKVPGFVEADTVSHCGGRSEGPYVYSVTLTDIATGWTESRAIWTKQAVNVVEAIKDIEDSLPFEILGFDCDNGSEFLNDHLVRYFQGKRIPLTRSRPYKKNDNAHVEQKNWSFTRQLLGHVRIENPDLVPVINDLYRNEWSQLKNFFCASLKLKAKVTVGAKLRRHYHAAQPSYARVLESPHVSEEAKAKLQALYATLNPFEIRARQVQKVQKIKEMNRLTFDDWMRNQYPV